MFAGSLHEGGCELHIKETARAELTEQHWNIYDADGEKYSWRCTSEMFFFRRESAGREFFMKAYEIFSSL